MNWRIRLTWWDKALLAVMAVAVVITVVRFAAGIGSIANINNAYPWGWWVGYGIMTMIAIGGVGFTITGLVEVLGGHRYHSFLRPAVLMAFLCYVSAITMLMVELGRPWKVWLVLVSWAPTSALYEVGWCAFLYLSVLAFEFAQVPVEQLGWGRALNVIRAIYIPVMLLGVTLSHLHQSSLGTLMTLIPHKVNVLWWSELLPLIFLFSAMMAGPAMAILEHLAAARWLGFEPRMDLLAGLARIEAWLVALFLALQMGDLFYRGAAGAMLSATWFALSFWVEIGFGLLLPLVLLLMPEVRESRRGLAMACGLVVAGVLLHRLNVAVFGLRVRHWETYTPSLGEIGITLGITAGALFVFGALARILPIHEESPPRTTARPAAQPGHALRGAEGCPDMTTKQPRGFPGTRIVVMLVVLVNLILTIALITQVRELQQRVASLPSDQPARAMWPAAPAADSPDPEEELCGVPHRSPARRDLAMEPAEIQRTIERMQTHPGANIPPGEFERIAASLLVLRCARCHGEETLNLMVLKTQPERIATIRRMAALPGSGVRPDQVTAIAQAFEKVWQ